MASALTLPVTADRLAQAGSMLPGCVAYPLSPTSAWIECEQFALEVVLHENATLLEFRTTWPGPARNRDEIAAALSGSMWRGTIISDEAGGRVVQLSFVTDVQAGLSDEQLIGWLVFVHNDVCVVFHDLNTHFSILSPALTPLECAIDATLPAVTPRRCEELLSRGSLPVEVSEEAYQQHREAEGLGLITVRFTGETLRLSYWDESGYYQKKFLPPEVHAMVVQLNQEPHIGAIEINGYRELFIHTVVYCGAGATDEQLIHWCDHTLVLMYELALRLHRKPEKR